MVQKTLFAVAAVALAAGPLPGDAPKKLAPDQFAALHKLIGPQPGESKWAAIPWRTNLQEARKEAVAAGKPLLLWRAGGGDVLGRA